MANDSKQVAVGKPKAGGAIYVAPAGSPLPTNATDPLDGAYKCLGYAADGGVENETKKKTEELTAWGGEVVDVTTTSFQETFKYTLIQALSLDVLKHVYGEDNVTGSLETGVTVKKTGADIPHGRFVLEVVLKGHIKRIVVPDGQVAEVSGIKYTDKDPVSYEVTLSAFPDEHGATSYEYIAKPA